jgi:hypothetical protein
LGVWRRGGKEETNHPPLLYLRGPRRSASLVLKA